ncbi:beta-mannanase [Pedobacter frigiditerrae]|uniref:mannan endo-1,4-beta-mannosidase n=1 Tax=Pedobacter frigiditerrae TaxID=2530452 RepID=A0A4R0MPI6_9SPHI|nr:glycoside hydrolase family 2 TIM barrel-domain containing protein [Pedobacter frigiditerrae]TCC88745.1 beta-mannanase [Pedobacter frigiditerrae]
MKIEFKKNINSCILLLLCIFSFKASAQEQAFGKPGTFMVGCNYWASHAGTHMWSNWRPEVIEADFKQLAANGIKVLRIFPLWPDFQPINKIYTSGGDVKYVSFKDETLPLTEVGQNGVSELQLQHFETLASLAKKHKLQLVVGLITGWMSGQLYVPPALEGKNILTDPESLMWQQKFVTTFVKRFKNNSSIVAWDFGNECNVIENVKNPFQAYVWSSVISGAIKSIDHSRPIVSGMHSLTADDKGLWLIKDQAALTDILTTHPYSLWTPYASQDPINSLRTIIHAAAETSMYSDVAGKPCLVEETGVMGPMVGGETEKVAFARTALFSNWANDGLGTFWWCAYDQTKLPYAPYNYASVEMELGLIKEDRTPKPVLGEFKKFSKFIDQLPFQILPSRKKEAICILSNNQDNWAVAYSSYILAKQAGFDFSFQKAGQEIKDAPLYLLPSIKGIDAVYNDYWTKLLLKVSQGATLYISLDDAYLPSFTEPLGIEIATNSKRAGLINFISKLPSGENLNFSASAERRYQIKNKTATLLATEADGNPSFLQANYGKGKIYLLTFPLELNLAKKPGAFDVGQPKYSGIYQTIANSLINERILTQQHQSVLTTEHSISDSEKVVILINYNPLDADTKIQLKTGWKIESSLYGDLPNGNDARLKGNDALVLLLKK